MRDRGADTRLLSSATRRKNSSSSLRQIEANWAPAGTGGSLRPRAGGAGAVAEAFQPLPEVLCSSWAAADAGEGSGVEILPHREAVGAVRCCRAELGQGLPGAARCTRLKGDFPALLSHRGSPEVEKWGGGSREPQRAAVSKGWEKARAAEGDTKG